MNQQLKANIFALSAILMWSTVASAFKIALVYYSPIMMLFWASITASFILLIFYLLDNKAKAFSINDLKKSSINGLFNPLSYYLVLFEAYNLLPAQLAQPLNYTWPIVLTIFTSIFFKQKMSWPIWLGLFVSFTGVIIISNQKSSFDNISILGIILAAGSSIIWSLYWILNMKDWRTNSQKLFYNFVFGTFYIFLYILISKENIYFEIKGILASVYIGFFEMGVTFFFWMKALELSENTGKINNLVFLSPFISFFFIAFILKEDIQLMTVIGLTVIIIGVFLQKLIKR